jgi:hypothetical protein
MSNGAMQVFSGSAITPEELLVLAEFAAPSHFVSDDAMRDAADNLADWTDHEASTIIAALHLAMHRHVHETVVELLRAAVMASDPEHLAHERLARAS